MQKKNGLGEPNARFLTDREKRELSKFLRSALEGGRLRVTPIKRVKNAKQD